MNEPQQFVAAPQQPALDLKNRLCARCGTIAKPAIASHAWGMFVASLIGGAWDALIRYGNTINGTANASAAEISIAGILFVAAVFHGRVCGQCQCRDLVPLDSPAGRRFMNTGSLR